MSQLELFTRESLLLDKPVIMSADELLQGSLALAALRYRSLQGEVFDPLRDDSGCLDHDVEIIIHGDINTDYKVVGISRAEVEEIHQRYETEVPSIQNLVILGIAR